MLKTQLELAIETLDEALDEYDTEVTKIKARIASALRELREYQHYQEKE